jgi:anti-sigma factor RsiW
MTCKDTRCLLDLYLDNELRIAKRRELEQHLNNCLDAALVYERSKDLVTLFAWPATGRLLPSRDFSISGYQVCTRNAESFNFVAVSTLSDRDLDKFIDQVRGQVK